MSLIASFFALGLHRYLSFEEISKHHHQLLAWREDNVALTVLVFFTVYVLIVGASVPGAIWMTILAGYLFGPYCGVPVALAAATIGSCVVFLGARYLVADTLRAKARPAMLRLEAGFRRNALSYLLALRLLPIVPFWLVNLVSALLGVPLRTFVVGTLLGIIPGTVIYALVGNSLATLIEVGSPPDLEILLRADILLPICGMALLALAPVIYGQIRRRDPRPPPIEHHT